MTPPTFTPIDDPNRPSCPECGKGLRRNGTDRHGNTRYRPCKCTAPHRVAQHQRNTRTPALHVLPPPTPSPETDREEMLAILAGIARGGSPEDAVRVQAASAWIRLADRVEEDAAEEVVPA